MFVLLIIAMRKHNIKNTITKRTKLFTCWIAFNNNRRNAQIYIVLFAENLFNQKRFTTKIEVKIM